ncbi:MAG: DUF1800 domain-containing protein [Chitinophaga sp.]|jgi:uncharacterized protein (DUF1800 family)|nr:DUF1800 domain-containing protein [Chitinophaga sp.]
MAVPTATGSIKKYRGKWNAEQAKHLLKRTMFGAKKEDITFFASKSLHKTIEALINTEEATPLPPLNVYNDTNYSDPEIALGQTWITATKQTGMEIGRRKNSYKSWWFNLMLNQNRTIREKMVLFWHNHFSTETNIVDNATSSYKHNVLLRQYALGNFKEMVKAITFDPCMLRYLNGNNNVKKAPDENYGRELQELFTVGKGPGSHYTEDDVKAAARVLTGYRTDAKSLPDIKGIFDPSRHDETDKKFSSFYNNTVIKGRRGKEGEQELDDLLNMIFANEEVSRFICRKLYRYFVYHLIDDNAEKNIIEPLAKTFRKNNYEIKPVLIQLLSSRHFFDKNNKGCIIKNPVDFTIGLCREFNVQFPKDDEYVDQYAFLLQLQQQAAQMQQNLGDPPNVAGWPAYYQQPQYDKIWISSDTLPKRNIFTDRMVNTGSARGTKKVIIDVVAFAQTLNNPSNPDDLINESVGLLYMMELPDKEKQYMKEGILLSGLQGMMSDHYWTDAWNKLSTKPDDNANKKDVTNKLKKLYQYLMNLPQYQLM